MRSLLLMLLTCLAIVFWPAVAEELIVQQAHDVESMLMLARKAHLSDQPEWRKINLYHASLGGVVSRVDDPTYFLAPNGKRDPQAELEATIRGAFDYSMAKTSRQPNVCRWIARYQYLSRSMKALGFDYVPQVCEGFSQWKAGIATHRATLVFASVYLNSPASMYGHAFIRFDSERSGEYNRLNDATVGYSVQGEEGAGALFLIRSLFGGYPGSFVFVPYYMKMREYSDLENRDLWEYRTNLRSEEIERMLAFVWEQSFTSMDYYFFDDNCALMLLASFEAARPSLNLVNQAKPWYIPLDMVKLVQAQPGLIEHIHYRPSQYNTLLANYDSAPDDEKRLALALALRDDAQPDLAGLAPHTQARALDLGLGIAEYLRNQQHSEAEATEITARQLRLAGVRSKIDVESEYKDQATPAERPDEGHDSVRVGVARGAVGGVSYDAINLRGGYHDSLDPQSGFTQGASSKMGDLYLRASDNQIRFERLDLFDVFVPSVQTEWVKPQTIKLNVSVRREVLKDNAQAPTALRIQAAAGKSYTLGKSTRGFVLADSVSNFYDAFALAVGTTFGVSHTVNSKLRAELSSSHYWLATGDEKESWQHQLAVGVAWDVLSNQNNVRLNLVRQTARSAVNDSRTFTDIQLAYFHYF